LTWLVIGTARLLKPKKGCEEEPIAGVAMDGWPCEVGKRVADGKFGAVAAMDGWPCEAGKRVADGKFEAGADADVGRLPPREIGRFCDNHTLWYGWMDVPA
jgi:hypothetical protein